VIGCIERGADGELRYGVPHEERRWVAYPEDARWWVTFWKGVWVPLLLLFSLLSTPFQFIDLTRTETIDFITYFVELNYLLDMCVSFRTAFIRNMPAERFLVDDSKLMAVHYVKSWFIVDLLALIAFSATWVFAFTGDENFLRYVLPLLVFRLLRIVRLGAFIQRLTNSLGPFMRTVSRLLQILGLVFVVAHWCGVSTPITTHPRLIHTAHYPNVTPMRCLQAVLTAHRFFHLFLLSGLGCSSGA
jgi:hypothetical protein